MTTRPKPSLHIVSEGEQILRYPAERINPSVPVAQWPFKPSEKKPEDVVITNVGAMLLDSRKGWGR